MTKHKFLLSLRDRLLGLPQDEVEERLSFYAEMIDDRMEEGLSEEDAVSAVGTVDQIAAQIIADIPHAEVTGAKTGRRRRLKTWETVLLILGAPLWIPLLIAIFAVILSLYVSIWSVVVSLWAVFASVVGCALGGIAAGIGLILAVNVPTGTAMLGAGFVCAGISVFLYYGCKAAINGTVILTKKIALAVKNIFSRGE